MRGPKKSDFNSPLDVENAPWVLGKIKQKYDSFIYNVSDTGVCHVQLNREKKSNSQNGQFYLDVLHFFKYVNFETSVRVIVLTSSAKNFSVGNFLFGGFLDIDG